MDIQIVVAAMLRFTGEQYKGWLQRTDRYRYTAEQLALDRDNKMVHIITAADCHITYLVLIRWLARIHTIVLKHCHRLVSCLYNSFGLTIKEIRLLVSLREYTHTERQTQTGTRLTA